MQDKNDKFKRGIARFTRNSNCSCRQPLIKRHNETKERTATKFNNFQFLIFNYHNFPMFGIQFPQCWWKFGSHPINCLPQNGAEKIATLMQWLKVIKNPTKKENLTEKWSNYSFSFRNHQPNCTTAGDEH